METKELLVILQDCISGKYPLTEATIDAIISILKMRLIKNTKEEILEKLEYKGYEITEFDNFIEFKYDDELVFYIHTPSERLYIECTEHPMEKDTLMLLAELMNWI